MIILGYLPGAGSFRLTTGLESTPVHHFHGTADPVVRYEWATKTKTGLEVWTLSMLWMYSMFGLYVIMYVLSILCKSCINIYIFLNEICMDVCMYSYRYIKPPLMVYLQLKIITYEKYVNVIQTLSDSALPMIGSWRQRLHPEIVRWGRPHNIQRDIEWYAVRSEIAATAWRGIRREG